MIAAFVVAGQWGSQTCAVETPHGDKCGNPAVAHVLIPVGGILGQLNVCTSCLRDVQILRIPIADRHSFGPHCNLPDAKWVTSAPGKPGTCTIPHDLTEDVERFANQPQGVTA